MWQARSYFLWSWAARGTQNMGPNSWSRIYLLRASISPWIAAQQWLLYSIFHSLIIMGHAMLYDFLPNDSIFQLQMCIWIWERFFINCDRLVNYKLHNLTFLSDLQILSVRRFKSMHFLSTLFHFCNRANWQGGKTSSALSVSDEQRCQISCRTQVSPPVRQSSNSCPSSLI